MAETLTVNTDPSTETADTIEGLTPEEQDSLKVGEEIQGQQEQLLAGKYKSAEELEKAYGELERKLGEKDNKDSEPAAEAEVQQQSEVSKETTETSEITQENFYLEDGAVDYSTVNKAYGEKLGDIFQESSIDPWAISQRFHDNNGSITETDYQQLESAGFTRQTVDAYLAGRSTEMGYSESNVEDISDQVVSDVKSYAGGEEAYGNMVQWASDNLSTNQITAFDQIVNTGSVDSIKLAVDGLKSQYEIANGREGKMVTGKAPAPNVDSFRSQAELVSAMNDKRYDQDPAYRQDIIAKLERSDNLTF
tara:strand:+ start:516 stop:1436 length:921 start_codon:yes stop_codon:yes gene_type:complete